MVIFWRLLLAHFIADFTFQTNWVAAIKRRRWWGMLLHASTHPIVSLALTYPYLGDTWVNTNLVKLTGWACVGLIFLTHLLQDQWRVYTIQNFNTPDSTLHFLWDQLVHYGAIFALFPSLAAYGGEMYWVPEAWSMVGILAVIVTHFGTVLVYFIEKDLWSHEYPGFDEKYVTMIERGTLALCFLLPAWWWLPAALAIGGAGAWARRTRFLEYSWLGFGVGAGLAIATGLAGRCLLS